MKEFNHFLLTNPLYYILIILGLGIIVVYYLYGSKIIGWFGERWTKEVLRKLPKDKYYIINNILIKSSKSTHQIDHVVISKYGIFCIETKQYNGFITGSKYDKKWVRHIGKKIIYYTNPIMQNYGHVKALSELLDIDESKIFNIVCIPSKARLKIKHDGELVRYSTLLNKILSYNNEIIHEVDKYINFIEKANITNKDTLKSHINNIKMNSSNNNDNLCPKCGGTLVKRTGKYGEFIGCSNYPKCKYTEKDSN